ncbi:hypothetical protein DFS34DRAFT_320866 [Phlyctochytrium arcticum]|nr:hypothetical protein DFS34DRAFT_320866 [Phlyctochytrium arcticum]
MTTPDMSVDAEAETASSPSTSPRPQSQSPQAPLTSSSFSLPTSQIQDTPDAQSPPARGTAAPLVRASATSHQTLKTSFPQARVKSIMREDKDLSMVTSDAIFAATLATEMFLEHLVEKSFEMTRSEGRKAVNYKDVAKAVAEHGEMAFLEGRSFGDCEFERDLLIFPII